MPRQRQKAPKEPRSQLQRVFMKRVAEELSDRGLSGNAIARRVGGPAQRTFNDVLNGADPRLETVQKIADALGISPSLLFMQRDGIEAQTNGQKHEENPYKRRVNSGTNSHLSPSKTGASAKHRTGKKG